MNVDYLFNVLNLYLSKEKDKKTILTITKGKNYLFTLGVIDTTNDFTKIILKDSDVDLTLLQNIIKTYKGNYMVIDDQYDYQKEKDLCKYETLFNNGRKLVFDKFTLEETNLLRNIIYNIDLNNNELRINVDKEEEKEIPYNLRLKQAGFSSFVTMFLVALWVVDIIVVILWIFKHIS